MVKISVFLLGGSLIQYAMATATLTHCRVQAGVCGAGTSVCTGNLFTLHFDSVPNVSLSTICGHLDVDIHSAASSYSVLVASNVDCSTVDFGSNANTMDLNVQLNKQSPQVELSALQNGLSAAFGSQGINFDSSLCGI